MKHLLSNLLFFFITAAILSSCTNPFKDLDIRVDTNVFKYTTVVEVAATSGVIPETATVTLGGQDAAHIYNSNGKKTFSVTGGMILLALDPKIIPADGAPIAFTVTIDAPNFFPVSIPVRISKEETSVHLKATMLNKSNMPEGLKSQTNTVALAANGATTTPVTITTTANAAVTETVKMEVPAGTQFKDANGNTITAGSLSVSTIVANTSSNDVLSIFPGGSLTLPEVKGAGGQSSAGVFLPAALTEISMSAGNTPVSTFTQPVAITLQLDQDYINPQTKQVIKAGDQLQAYSYSHDAGIWQHEGEGTVVLENGRLVLKTQTTHLSFFAAGYLQSICSQLLNLSFKAAWLSNGITHPVSYKVFAIENGNRGKQLAQGSYTVTDGTEGSIKNLPSTGAIIVFYDIEGNELAASTVNNPCEALGKLLITLANSPISNNPKVTMQLYVRCPNQAQRITLLPTFYLYYKKTGEAQSAFKLIGTVTQGYISTSLLNTTTNYDFKAVWGSYVKYANGQQLKVDNAAIVGDAANELIGTKDGANNLRMLTEVCRENGY